MIHVSGKPPIYLERRPSYVLTVASESEPGRTHYVVVWSDGTECSCSGWQFNKKCWHTDEIAQGNWVNRIYKD